MVKVMTTLCAAIIEAAKYLSDEENLTISLKPSGDTLVLSFGDPNLPSVPLLKESLAETLVILGYDVAGCLDADAEEKRDSFKDLLESELRNIQDSAEMGELDEWEGVFDDIAEAVKQAKRNINTSDLEEAQRLEQAAEELRSEIENFENSQKSISLAS